MKKIYLVLMAAATLFLLNGCSQDFGNLGATKQNEMIYHTSQSIKLDHNVVENKKDDKSYYQLWREANLMDNDISMSEDNNKNFIINGKVYQVRFSNSNGNSIFNLYDVKENKKVVNFDYRYRVIIFNDTDKNNTLYFGLKKIYNNQITYRKFDKLYSFDGTALKEIRKDLKEKSLYFGTARIISSIIYTNKYIVYVINAPSYNKYEVVNILNNKEIDFKGTVLAFKDNKALVYRDKGNLLFNNLQYQLTVVNLDTGNETNLMIENEKDNQALLSFYESKSQLIVRLPNNQNIDIVSLKNVPGDLSKVTQLKAKIYNIDHLNSEEYEMTLKDIGYSIKTNFDDTQAVLFN